MKKASIGTASPSSTTTAPSNLIVSSLSLGAELGFFVAKDSIELKELSCLPCPRGIVCPTGSRIETFGTVIRRSLQGTTATGDPTTDSLNSALMRVEPGHYVHSIGPGPDLFYVYKCQSLIPRGVEDKDLSCKGGLQDYAKGSPRNQRHRHYVSPDPILGTGSYSYSYSVRASSDS